MSSHHRERETEWFQSSRLSDAQFQSEISLCLQCPSKPCRDACPCYCSPYDFIALAREGRWEAAAGEILSANPLGEVCGAVCPDSFCVAACKAQHLVKPVDIPAVQRYIVAKARALNPPLLRPSWSPLPPLSSSSPRRVAIVGGGPAGLACCAVLARKGVSVDIFEKSDSLGGATRSIPGFRLPSSVISSDCTFVSDELAPDLVHVHLNHSVTSLDELSSQFDALAVCTGLQDARRLGFDGEGEHTIAAMDFLWNVADYPVQGQHCAVLGGGPVAVDVATTLKVRGAASVSLIYRRSIAEMSISTKERAKLVEFGIDIIPRMICTRVTGNGKDVGKVCLRRCVTSGGRLDDAKMTQLGDELIFTDFSRVFVAAGNVPVSFGGSRPLNCVFAGDHIRGASTVVEASAFGKAAASAFLRYFSGQPLKLDEQVRQDKSRVDGFDFMPVSLATSMFGIALENPFLLSASPLTDGLDECRRALNAGWAGVVTKTAFQRQFIHVPNAYMTKFGPQTYGNADNVSAIPLETVCETIRTLRKEYPRKLIAASTGGSLTGDKGKDKNSWVSNTLLLEEAGAQWIEYSLSCPQGGEGAEAHAIASQSPTVTAEIVEWILSSTSSRVPKLFKLTAAVTSASVIVAAIRKVMDAHPDSLAGITLGNSFPALDSRFDPQAGAAQFWNTSRVVGMAGAGVLPITRLAISSVRHLKVPISANGGVCSAEDAAGLLALGCESVQICTAATVRGVEWITLLMQSFSFLLKARGFSSVRQLVGSAEGVVDFMKLSGDKNISTVDANACIKCSVCVSTCPYGAISMDIEDGGLPKIDPARCISCGMCVLNCPASALSLRLRSPQEKDAQFKFASSIGIETVGVK